MNSSQSAHGTHDESHNTVYSEDELVHRSDAIGKTNIYAYIFIGRCNIKMSLSLSLAASNVLLHSPLLGPAISVAGLRFCRSAPPHLWLRGASTPSIKLNLPFSSSALQVNLSHRQYFCPPLQNVTTAMLSFPLFLISYMLVS